MTDISKSKSEEEEIRLKNVLEGVKEFGLELKRNWFWIALLIALFTLLNLYLTSKKDITYPTSLTFMVNEEEGGGAGGVGSILSTFGLGGGGGGEYNLDKIKELSKTLRIIKEALFVKGNVDEKEDFFANHLIREYKFHELWKEDTTGLKNFLFTDGDFKTFSRTENKALKSIYYKVRGNDELGIEGIMSIAFEGATGIFDMQIRSTNENLSIYLLEALYEKLSSFYIEGTIEKPKATFDNLQVQVDSLNEVLRSKEYQLAKATDSNQRLVTRTAQLKQDRLRRDVQLLTLEYGKNLEQLKLADFALKNATPFFQEIDRPIAPIPPSKRPYVKAIIFGIALGALLGIIYFIIRKIFRDALAEEV